MWGACSRSTSWAPCEHHLTKFQLWPRAQISQILHKFRLHPSKLISPWQHVTLITFGGWCGCHFQQRGFIWRPSSLITLAAPVCLCSSSLDAKAHSSLIMQMVDPGQASDSSWSLWWWTLKGSLLFCQRSWLYPDRLLGPVKRWEKVKLGLLKPSCFKPVQETCWKKTKFRPERSQAELFKSCGSLFFFEATCLSSHSKISPHPDHRRIHHNINSIFL